jgi:hypothetical protein
VPNFDICKKERVWRGINSINATVVAKHGHRYADAKTIEYRAAQVKSMVLRDYKPQSLGAYGTRLNLANVHTRVPTTM